MCIMVQSMCGVGIKIHGEEDVFCSGVPYSNFYRGGVLGYRIACVRRVGMGVDVLRTLVRTGVGGYQNVASYAWWNLRTDH